MVRMDSIDWPAEERTGVIISGDLRISQNEFERKAWRDSGLTAFFFAKGWMNDQVLGSSLASDQMVADHRRGSPEDSPGRGLRGAAQIRKVGTTEAVRIAPSDGVGEGPLENTIPAAYRSLPRRGRFSEPPALGILVGSMLSPSVILSGGRRSRRIYAQRFDREGGGSAVAPSARRACAKRCPKPPLPIGRGGSDFYRDPVKVALPDTNSAACRFSVGGGSLSSSLSCYPSFVFVVMKKRLPKFKNEDAERKFWAAHDSTDYIDWRAGQRTILPNLKPTSQTISLRLPKPMLDRLKQLANKRDVPR